MTGSPQKSSYWVDSRDHSLMTHAHMPASGRARAAVLICNTIGYEAVHAYRGLVYLADTLAAEGFAAFRFDLGATGNSSGHADNADLVERWQSNIADQVTHLREAYGFEKIVVVAFRTAATLLAQQLEQLQIDALMLWEPVTRGRTFVRETRAVAQFAEGQPAAASNKIESGGFEFSENTLVGLESLKVESTAIPQGLPIFVASRRKNRQINAETMGDRGAVTELRTLDFDRMVCEPHYTSLPEETVAAFIGWLDDCLATPEQSIPDIEAASQTTLDGGITESAFRSPGNNLFGIVSRPQQPPEEPPICVVLCIAGSVCTIGPNRLYVQVARALAANGFNVVRFDLRNLGDSVNGVVEEANSPYPSTAAVDLQQIIDHCRDSLGLQSFALAGLCSGAHAAYHFALENAEPAVERLLLINPLTYYYEPGMSLDNPLEHKTVRSAKSYARSARNARNWRRLLTGRINYRRLLRFSLGVLKGLIRNGIRKVSALWTRHPLSRMDEDLARLNDRNLRIDFVFSESDPGYWIARVESPATFRRLTATGESSVTVLKDANHTLSSAANRSALIDALRAMLVS